MADLLALAHKSAAALRRPFNCRRLGVELEVRLMPANEVAAALAEASREWGEAELRHAVDEQALSLLVIRAQMARCVFHDGEPVSRAVVDAVDDGTLRHWAAQYATLEDQVDPPLESWTSEQIDAFLAGLKKNSPDCVGRLKHFDGPTLIGLLLFTAAQLTSCETSTSCEASPSSM